MVTLWQASPGAVAAGFSVSGDRERTASGQTLLSGRGHPDGPTTSLLRGDVLVSASGGSARARRTVLLGLRFGP